MNILFDFFANVGAVAINRTRAVAGVARLWRGSSLVQTMPREATAAVAQENAGETGAAGARDVTTKGVPSCGCAPMDAAGVHPDDYEKEYEKYHTPNWKTRRVFKAMEKGKVTEHENLEDMFKHLGI